MKNYLRLLSTPVLALILFSSCQKEVDGRLPEQPVNDSIYIKKFIVLDTTVLPSPDTVRTLDFTYDASKRLTRYIHKIYEPGGSIRAIHTYTYSYTGTDTLPSRIEEDIVDFIFPANNGKDTAYYFYQGGSIVKDSSGDASEYFVDRITKQSANHYTIFSTDFVDPAGFSYDTTYIQANWQNGNLLQQIDSTWISGFMGSFWDIRTVAATYDGKPNPFRRLVLPYPVPFNRNVFGWALEGIFAPTANNILFIDNDGSTLTTRYQYRSDGYPVLSWDDDGAKCIYQYTRL